MSQRALQDGYDRLAAEYVARVFGELQHKPLDRGLLDRFIEMVRPLGPACDLGCGPGEVALYLHERGLPAIGVDLSPEMVAQARRLSPEISFRQGTMLGLDLEDESLGGIVAFYSIIHVPRDQQARAFAEMRRTLRPGGVVLVAFHVGDEDLHLEELWGQQVSLDFLFFRREEIEQRLVDARFVIEESLERPPYPDVEVQTRRAYIVARRPAAGA